VSKAQAQMEAAEASLAGRAAARELSLLRDMVTALGGGQFMGEPATTITSTSSDTRSTPISTDGHCTVTATGTQSLDLEPTKSDQFDKCDGHGIDFLEAIGTIEEGTTILNVDADADVNATSTGFAESSPESLQPAEADTSQGIKASPMPTSPTGPKTLPAAPLSSQMTSSGARSSFAMQTRSPNSRRAGQRTRPREAQLEEDLRAMTRQFLHAKEEAGREVARAASMLLGSDRALA